MVKSYIPTDKTLGVYVGAQKAYIETQCLRFLSIGKNNLVSIKFVFCPGKRWKLNDFMKGFMRVLEGIH